MNNTLTLHLIQWRVIPGDIEGNLERAASLISSALPEKGDLVVLPEMFPSGFYYSALEAMASRSDTVLQWMARTASQYGVGVAGSLPVQRPGGVANTMVLVDGRGETAAVYDKIHLFPVAQEDRHFVAGSTTVVADWEGLRVGLAICFDLRFPEMAGTLCRAGADLVVVSAQWPRARVDHFRDIVRVRAMENQVFIAAVNSCGDDGQGLVLGGGSTVVGPAGEVLGVLGPDEGILSVRIVPGDVERVRETFPVLKVRREDVFGK